MKRFIIISIMVFFSLPLCAQGVTSSPYVEVGTLIVNNTGFNPTLIRVIPVTRPTPMHIHNGPVNATFAARFVVAKADVLQTGTWAWACGWNTAANSAVSGVTASVIRTGCAAYFEPGLDGIVGKWRVPTQREMNLIVVARFELALTPGFIQLATNATYWTATQNNATVGWAITMAASSMYVRSKTLNLSVRCIRDL